MLTKRHIFFLFLAVALVFSYSNYIKMPEIVRAEESLEERKARLEAELAQYEAEIKQKEAELATQQKQTGSIKNDISILTKEIEAAKIKIKARTTAISKLADEIGVKSRSIDALSAKLEREKASLAQFIRKTREGEEATLTHLLLSADDVSEFYGELDQFEAIQEAIQTSLEEVKSIRERTLVEKSSLEESKNKELDAKAELESAKRKVEKNESEKKVLLNASQKKEADYQKILAERRAKAAQIRAALFSLRDTAAIPFGTALDIAMAAEAKTGVRPAFLLAILTQESALGKNVGSCYLTNLDTGSGASSKSGAILDRVMNPTRDVPVFKTITASLGRDPYKTLVSCPQAIGWGGAMGPAQFIPSTWNLYKTRIANSLGLAVADPWVPRDAFFASSLYLSDLGAGAKTWSAEWNAACRYYSGKPCAAAPYAASYGNSVMQKAVYIQENQIDPLKNL